MSAGLFALFDDVAALVRLTAASLDDVGAAAGRASLKAAGVVVDDTAVTPRYVHGLEPERELSIIARIAKGSLVNKIAFILPAALVLSEFLPVLLTPLLMLGGVYLCYEGAEKVWEMLGGHDSHETEADEPETVHEHEVVSGAVRTDFILSAEIMVIALNEVAHQPFLARTLILSVVALLITALVYGVVAVIVKMDDAGLALASRSSRAAQVIGRGLVRAMPIVLSTLANVGVAAMLWVGGHILLKGTDDLGWHPLYAAVHHVEHFAGELIPAISGTLSWCAGTMVSLIVGLAIGAVVVLVMSLLPKKHG